MTEPDLEALAIAQNERDAAAGLIPRRLEDEAVLRLVAKLLLPYFDGDAPVSQP